VHVDGDREAALALDEHDRRLLDRVRAASALHGGAHALDAREVEQPAREVEQRQAELEEGTAAGLGAAQPPGGLLHATAIRARAHRADLAELPTAHEAVERLRIEPEAMVVRDHHHLLRLLRRRDDPLDGPRADAQRPLAHHVLPRAQRREDVHLVQVVGRGHHDRIEVLQLEQFLDVGADVAHAEPLGERPGLRGIVVTEGGELDAAHLAEHRQMRGLGDGPEAEDPDAQRRSGSGRHGGGFRTYGVSCPGGTGPTMVPG